MLQWLALKSANPQRSDRFHLLWRWLSKLTRIYSVLRSVLAYSAGRALNQAGNGDCLLRFKNTDLFLCQSLWNSRNPHCPNYVTKNKCFSQSKNEEPDHTIPYFTLSEEPTIS